MQNFYWFEISNRRGNGAKTRDVQTPKSIADVLFREKISNVCSLNI